MTRVDDLILSVRSKNALRNMRIETISDLVQRTEADLMCAKNFGRKSLKEIREVLAEMDLSLAPCVPTITPPSPSLFRVPIEERARWRQAAVAAGISVPEWRRRACNIRATIELAALPTTTQPGL